MLAAACAHEFVAELLDGDAVVAQIAEIERDELGVTHAELDVYLLGLSGSARRDRRGHGLAPLSAKRSAGRFVGTVVVVSRRPTCIRPSQQAR